ncbi:unnamed protein product [Anisakis simplex]|uniref:ZP domain-containing protein n=1 Tax=Anisakis simplex TaxID=6269 RepID=A0A0M3KA86_ANISI|nr:unnamed protein product [Anisakis simplex]
MIYSLRVIDLVVGFCCFLTLIGASEPRDYGKSSKEVQILDEDIIELPAGQFPGPDCQYKVHLGDRLGPVLTRQVHIGEPVYHRWSCNYGSRHAPMYCMMVYNCTVSTTTAIHAQTVPIIDEFGCSLFPTLIPHPSYLGDLEAGLKSTAFSLDIDEPAVTFNCGLKLLLKLEGWCRRPQCIPEDWFKRRRGNGVREDERRTQTHRFVFKR